MCGTFSYERKSLPPLITIFYIVSHDSLTKTKLISFENITRIDFIKDVIETSVIAVGDNGFAMSLEVFKVID